MLEVQNLLNIATGLLKQMEAQKGSMKLQLSMCLDLLQDKASWSISLFKTGVKTFSFIENI